MPVSIAVVSNRRGSITDETAAMEVNSGRERIQTSLEQSGALSQTAIPLMRTGWPNAFS